MDRQHRPLVWAQVSVVPGAGLSNRKLRWMNNQDKERGPSGRETRAHTARARKTGLSFQGPRGAGSPATSLGIGPGP